MGARPAVVVDTHRSGMGAGPALFVLKIDGFPHQSGGHGSPPCLVLEKQQPELPRSGGRFVSPRSGGAVGAPPALVSALTAAGAPTQGRYGRHQPSGRAMGARPAGTVEPFGRAMGAMGALPARHDDKSSPCSHAGAIVSQSTLRSGMGAGPALFVLKIDGFSYQLGGQGRPPCWVLEKQQPVLPRTGDWSRLPTNREGMGALPAW